MYRSSDAVLVLGPLRFSARRSIIRLERVNIISDVVNWVLRNGSYPLSHTINFNTWYIHII